ncbi:uncharacterized protein F5891DRAFT_442560 [Suillus fuscotomentosus]|uniref:Uncharacterized protein n=1 Tax=Suillus fuscotomentosus TaxID=1912939 RepID=A0AAD4HKK8_9AGAM|nr:uncharacterized protein F5891DRAFT_442560 [Suillus fuscotomentosus]KAG1898889.1 hypothetical protein F5891DRAFT_442560 [Suillus fuscotomentosus]
MNLLMINRLAAVIIFEHSSYIFNKQRYLEDKQESDTSFHAALEQYVSSPHAGAVMKGVSDTVHAYEKAVATSAKEKDYSCSPAKAQLINAVIEITLNHRLHLDATQRRWCSEVEQRFLSSECEFLEKSIEVVAGDGSVRNGSHNIVLSRFFEACESR